MSKSIRHIPLSRDSVSKPRAHPIPREDKWPELVIDLSESDGDDGASFHPRKIPRLQPSPWVWACPVGNIRKGFSLPSASERDESTMKESEDIHWEDNSEQHLRYDAAIDEADPAKGSSGKKGKRIALPSASGLDESKKKGSEEMHWEDNAEQHVEADAVPRWLPYSVRQILKVQDRMLEEITEGRKESVRVMEELADLKQRVNVLLDQVPASAMRKRCYKMLF